MTASLSRNREYAVIGGVCSGLAVFLRVNPTIVRGFFILLVFGHGIGAMLYLLLWIMIPIDGQVNRPSPARTTKNGSQGISEQTRYEHEIFDGLLREPQTQLGIVVGFGLIFIGILFLLPNLQISWPNWLNFELIWPLFLLFGGLALLFRRPRGVYNP